MSEKPTAEGLCPVCGTPGPGSGESFCEVCGTLVDWDAVEAPAAGSRAASSRPGATSSGSLSSGSASADARAASAAERPGGASAEAGGSRPERPAVGNPSGPAEGASGATRESGVGAGAPAGGSERRSGGEASGTASAPASEPTSTAEPGGAAAASAGEPALSRLTSAGEEPRSLPGSAERRTEPGGGQTRARALLVPVPDAEPAPAVSAVLPGRPEPARPSVRAVTADEESGITCWQCGVNNSPDRTFCRNDGAPLDRGGQQAPTVARRRGERLAGWRPRVPWKRVLIIGGAVAVLVGAALLTPTVIRAIRDHFTDPVALPPAAVSASNSDAAHPPQAAFDGVSNSWWGPGFSGDSAGQYLQANYSQPVKLEKIMITPGVSAQPEELDAQARPERFDLLITDSSGRTSLSHHQLADGGPQVIDAAMEDAVQVDVILRGAYGTAENKQVAVAEVELFGRTPS